MTCNHIHDYKEVFLWLNGEGIGIRNQGCGFESHQEQVFYAWPHFQHLFIVLTTTKTHKAPGGTPTHNPWLRRPMPFPLGHRGTVVAVYYSLYKATSSLTLALWHACVVVLVM